MSSDWKDTNAIWRGTNGQSADEDFYEPAPLEGQPQVPLHSETDPLSHYESNIEEPSELMPTRFEVVGGLLRQLSPVLAPLLFGGVTFLFILPFVLSARAYLSTSSSLPTGLLLLAIGLVLLAFALGQGIMLYFAGSNDVLWSLGMICGFSLFLLTGCFAIFGLIPSAILLVGLVVVGFLLARLYIRPTPEGQVDIVEAFGKHSRTLLPGLNFRAPWEKVAYKLDTREKVWSCPIQKVPVSRSEEIHLAATISYQLLPEDAHLAALYVNDWEKSLQELFVSTMQDVVADISPEDFIAWPQNPRSRQAAAGDPRDVAHWDRINSTLAHRMQDQVAHWGVQINEVRIRDVALVPHLLPLAEPHPPASAQPVNVGGARSPAQPAPAQLHQAQPHPKKPQPAAPTPEKAQLAHAQPRPPEPPPAAPAAPAPSPKPQSPKVSKADQLKDAYEAVRSGHISDPDTIREIASRFLSIANNPAESQSVDFDADRAAHTLLERATYLEELARADADADYDNETQPDWSMRSQR